jgi:hypothetical protein
LKASDKEAKQVKDDVGDKSASQAIDSKDRIFGTKFPALVMDIDHIVNHLRGHVSS